MFFFRTILLDVSLLTPIAGCFALKSFHVTVTVNSEGRYRRFGAWAHRYCGTQGLDDSMWREVSSWSCSSVLLVGACLPSLSGGGVVGLRSVALQRVVMNMSDVHPSVEKKSPYTPGSIRHRYQRKCIFWSLIVSDVLGNVQIEAYGSPTYSVLLDYWPPFTCRTVQRPKTVDESRSSLLCLFFLSTSNCICMVDQAGVSVSLFLFWLLVKVHA